MVMTSFLVRSLSRRLGTRTLSTDPRRFDSISMDLEHYTSGRSIGDLEEFTRQGKYSVQTYNSISPKGLARFPQDLYDVAPAEYASGPAQALLIRSHKLRESEVDMACRAIARCGVGTNNIPVARMTELGIPVFNTPGANANAVKELIICGLFLGSRRIVDGINHMKDLGSKNIAKESVEKDKAMFGGHEVRGKTIAVLGLGHIGASVARDCFELGMSVKGYDPGLSVSSALNLPADIAIQTSISSTVTDADYVSLNIPYIKGKGGTHEIIGNDVISQLKPGAVVLNFARGELVDSMSMKEFLDTCNGRYISDFPDDVLWGHKNAIILPHLGASTSEAEDQAAAMAADSIREYMEHGTVRNSVNFPTTELEQREEGTIRITVVNRNVPGVLSNITDIFAKNKLNIIQQINQSRDTLAYNVIDIDPATADDEQIELKRLQKEVTMLDGVLSSRVLFGSPGAGFARNVDGEYFA